MNRAPRDARTAGFTLAELLVSLVIAGFLAGVILQLVTSQARFTDIQYARQEVQDNARGTLELLGSELRTVPLPGGLLMAGADTIRFRSPMAWGVYCGTSGGSRFVVFDKGVWVTAASAGIPLRTGLVLQRTEGSLDGTIAPVFDSDDDAARTDTLAPTLAAASPCGGLTDDATRTVVVKFDDVDAGVPGTPGLAAYVWRSVAYGGGVADAAGDRWMTRELSGSGRPEPLAGPIENLTIRYLNAAGVAFSAPVDAVRRDSVRSVRVIVTMKARQGTGVSSGTRKVSTQDSITVSLRNFR
ncbi:MAG TPA: type II secretion system protein [Longimicrobium sp.]|jgi:prepilin-type N-terminal cleavage/methylation domain-containing protein|nr:type II secretion system protein [Longimicrobium sp.]